MPPTNQSEADLIGVVLATLPVLIPIFINGKRVQGILNLFRQFAAMVAAKNTEKEHENGHHTHAAMVLMMGATDKRVDDVKEEARQRDEQLRHDLRNGMDSVLASMNRFRADVRVGLAELHEKVDATNQRVNVIGNELIKLQQVVYSMNGNSKHEHADEDKPADE